MIKNKDLYAMDTEAKMRSIGTLEKGLYKSTKTHRSIEILDVNVHLVLENGKHRQGLVLYKYVDSDTLRVAPRMWFVEIVENKPRFIKVA